MLHFSPGSLATSGFHILFSSQRDTIAVTLCRFSFVFPGAIRFSVRFGCYGVLYSGALAEFPSLFPFFLFWRRQSDLHEGPRIELTDILRDSSFERVRLIFSSRDLYKKKHTHVMHEQKMVLFYAMAMGRIVLK